MIELSLDESASEDVNDVTLGENAAVIITQNRKRCTTITGKQATVINDGGRPDTD